MTSEVVKMLMQELRSSEREILHLVATAPERYKVYSIKKRSGGMREIAHPSIELKMAQRAIIKNILSDLPIHDCATAYRKGSSIRINAQIHAHNRPILKYDFREFFPSITEQAWLSYCESNEIFDRTDAIVLGRLLFRRAKHGRVLRLSIGAPSSPILSNILLNHFDAEVQKRVSEHKIAYTRYADDMTFSAKRTYNLTVVDAILRSVINQMSSPKLQINENKTNLVTTKFRRQITGIVLTNDGRVSIGRDRKRKLRAAIHRFSLGQASFEQIAHTAGMLAFASDVEPEFEQRMERVYGRDIILKLKGAGRAYRRPPSEINKDRR